MLFQPYLSEHIFCMLLCGNTLTTLESQPCNYTHCDLFMVTDIDGQDIRSDCEYKLLNCNVKEKNTTKGLQKTSVKTK